MLIGCGCNCDEPIPSSVPHGSYHSSGTGASSLASGVSSGDPQGYCGPCYNLPNEWDVTLSSAWWNYDYPARDYDCRSGLNGTFVLRPYGAASLSPKASLQSSFVIEDICTVWKSDQLAQFVSRLNRDGTANAGCRNSVDSISRIELVSGTSSFSGIGTCRSAVFMLFVWWLRPGMFLDEEQEGQWWSWTVPYDYSGGTCHYRNCVRCWGADVGPPVGFFNAYSLNAGQIANWSTIPVCPHR